MSKTRVTKKQQQLRREIQWYGLLTFCVLLFLILAIPAKNGFRATIQSLMMGSLGYAAFALPFLIGFVGTYRLLDRYKKTRKRYILGAFLMFASLLIFVTATGEGFRELSLARSYDLGKKLDGGGIFGDLIGLPLSMGLGKFPLNLIALCLLIVSVIVMAQQSILEYVAFLKSRFADRTVRADDSDRADRHRIRAGRNDREEERARLDEIQDFSLDAPFPDPDIDAETPAFRTEFSASRTDERAPRQKIASRRVISRPDDSEPNLIDRLEAFLATGEDLPLAPKSHREMWRDEQTEWERNFASDSVAHRFPENSFGDFTEPHDREIRSRDTAHLMYPPNRPPRQEQPGRESIPDPRRKRLNPDAERGYTGRRRRGGVSRDSEAIAPQVEPRESEIYETFATLHLPRDFDDLAMGEAPDDVVDPMSHTPRTSQEEVIRADILTDDTGKPSIGIGALRDTRVTPAVTSKAKTKKPKKYRLPSLDLLELPKEDAADTKEHTQSIAKKLETTLRSFHVDAEVRSFKRGPAITMFEVVLSPGVKMSKVQGLADDIALSLAASQVRIAPIAGKSAVGIEVPNKTSSMVRLREIIDVPEFKSSKSKLTMALGKDIAGNPIVGDLASMPHLLIAGATGSGKSVCVNTIISSILFHAAPDEVQFLMIDPKIVELSGYNGIPHLIMPVVTDPKKASIALNWAVQEMERRYAAFSESRVKDIKSYNQKIEDARNAEVPDGEMHGEPMPQIVVIIDELADLMMAAPKQVEDSICRIAQKARAAGIHLIVATQRPSVDVITGLIKANIPSRIAFAVSSQVDSRTIIDMQGAEKLLGKGDMLYYPASAPKPKRVQGAFMTDQEVERMVAFASSQQIERNGEEIVLEESVSMESGEEEVDELLHEAIQFVLESGMASASLLQRKYRIGYNRAARLIDSMEERGIVGPSRGSKPREILTRHHDEL